MRVFREPEREKRDQDRRNMVMKGASSRSSCSSWVARKKIGEACFLSEMFTPFTSHVIEEQTSQRADEDNRRSRLVR